MITKGCWEKTLLKIKRAKNIINLQYMYIERDRREATTELIITIFITPFVAIFDLILFPLELMYIIAYKILWKNLGGNKNG